MLWLTGVAMSHVDARLHSPLLAEVLRRPDRGRRRRSAISCTLAVLLVATISDQVRVAPPALASPAKPAAVCPQQRPDEAAAKVTARLCGGRVEVASLRSETHQVFANADGSMSMEVAALPQRARGADGTWSTINLNLMLSGGRWRPAASAVDVTFSAGGAEPLVTMADGKHAFTLSWPDKLPAPQLSGDSATYAEVVPSVDLVVRATRTAKHSDSTIRTQHVDVSIEPSRASRW